VWKTHCYSKFTRLLASERVSVQIALGLFCRRTVFKTRTPCLFASSFHVYICKIPNVIYRSASHWRVEHLIWWVSWNYIPHFIGDSVSKASFFLHVCVRACFHVSSKMTHCKSKVRSTRRATHISRPCNVCVYACMCGCRHIMYECVNSLLWTSCIFYILP
jgi:hypothetical protein